MASNPFLLWGSYLGASVGAVVAYFSFAYLFRLAEQGLFHPIHMVIPFGLVAAGFLAGWGAHVLFRT